MFEYEIVRFSLSLELTTSDSFYGRDASSRSQPADHSSSSDRSEEPRTPDSIDEPWDGSDGRGSPQGGRRYPGVQMMGSGLLAEIKAKQERRAYKVGRNGFYSGSIVVL